METERWTEERVSDKSYKREREREREKERVKESLFFIYAHTCINCECVCVQRAPPNITVLQIHVPYYTSKVVYAMLY
jgi:hypothetical protein